MIATQVHWGAVIGHGSVDISRSHQFTLFYFFNYFNFSLFEAGNEISINYVRQNSFKVVYSIFCDATLTYSL